MDHDTDRLQTVGEDPPPVDDPSGLTRPSWFVSGILLIGIVVLLVAVSRPPAASPDPTPVVVPPTLPDEATTSTTVPPLARAAFGEESNMTWAPASGLANLTSIASVIEHERDWYLAGTDGETTQLATSTDGIRWEYVDTPSGPEGQPGLIRHLASVPPNLAAVGTYSTDTGEVAAVWWSRDANTWRLEDLPVDSFIDAPVGALSYVDIGGATTVGTGLVVVVHEVITNTPSPSIPWRETTPEPLGDDRVPADWREALEEGAVLVSDSTSLNLYVEPFIVDSITWDELGLVPYQRSRTLSWVVSADGVPIQAVQDPIARIVPLGTLADGRAYGIKNLTEIVVSEKGLEWSTAASVSGLDSLAGVAPWEDGWLRTSNDAVVASPDGDTWVTLTPDQYLGPEPWYLVQLSTSNLGIMALAARPNGGPPLPVTVTGTLNERIVVDMASGDLTVERADGVIFLGDLGSYLFGRGALELEDQEIVLFDLESGGAVARVPLKRWINAWTQSRPVSSPDMALVHSVDGETWSARTVGQFAGSLAEGITSISLTDRFALLAIHGNGAVPSVWIGSPRTPLPAG